MSLLIKKTDVSGMLVSQSKKFHNSTTVNTINRDSDSTPTARKQEIHQSKISNKIYGIIMRIGDASIELI